MARTQRVNHTQELKLFVKSLGIDLVGIADVAPLRDLPLDDLLIGLNITFKNKLLEKITKLRKEIKTF